MENTITIGTVCFLIDKEQQKILFLERSNDPMKNKYTGVGGKTHFEEDIYDSCLREIKEETGFDAHQLQLKGVVKTILEGRDSSWILFVYVCDEFSGEQISCPEGELHWIPIKEIFNLNLIGFIREIIADILEETTFIEATMLHDIHGEVLN